MDKHTILQEIFTSHIHTSTIVYLDQPSPFVCYNIINILQTLYQHPFIKTYSKPFFSYMDILFQCILYIFTRNTSLLSFK